MKKKLLSLFALLLFAVQCVWAEKKLYAEVNADGITMFLHYGEVPAGKPYYSYGKWVVNENGEENETKFIEKITKVTTSMSCMDYAGSLEYLFSDFKSLKEISGLSTLVTEKITDMQFMFAECNALTSLDFTNCITSNVTDMEYMFFDCYALTSLNFSNFNTSNVRDMQFMFGGCTSLTSLDLSSFNTAKVTNMVRMFKGCSALTSLNLSSFDTGQVFQMNEMFRGCRALTSLDLSSFKTGQVSQMAEMFSGCSALTSLNLSSFNTASVVTMEEMFKDCSALTSLDLSSFKTSKVIIDVSSMFWGCSELTTIIVGDGWKESLIMQSFVKRSNTFYNCSKLPGYDGGAIDASKAHTGTDGYLTMMLNETDDNSSWISEHLGQRQRVMLKRTLKAGSYNTFSVPFYMNAIPEGWTAKELDNASLADGTLTLNFIAAGASRIEANRAYLVKVTADVVNPTFSDVTISNTTYNISTVTNVIRFMPTSGMTTLTDAKENILFLAEGNKLKHPSEANQRIKGFRGYFLLLGNAAHASTFSMDFGDGETTSVNEELRMKNEESAAAQWYTLDGVRLSGKPSSKGIYIVNGKKIVIK